MLLNKQRKRNSSQNLAILMNRPRLPHLRQNHFSKSISTNSSCYWNNSRVNSSRVDTPSPIIPKYLQGLTQCESLQTPTSSEMKNIEEVQQLEKWRAESLKNEENKKLNTKQRSISNTINTTHILSSIEDLDYGKKILNLMDTIIDNESLFYEIKPTENDKRINSISVASPNRTRDEIETENFEHNKQLLEKILLRKLRIKKITLDRNLRNLKGVNQELKDMAFDIVGRFKNLSKYYNHNLELQVQVADILKQLVTDTQSQDTFNLNQLDDKQKKQARIAYFEKLKMLEKDLKFCDKRIGEKKKELLFLEQRTKVQKTVNPIISHTNQKIHNLISEIDEIPRKKAQLILNGHSHDSKLVNTLTKTLKDKQIHLQYLQARVKVKVEQVDHENNLIDDELKRCQLSISYLKHAKESYKIDLKYYLKGLFSGEVPIDYYEKPIVDYMILLRRSNINLSDLIYWDGLDPADLEFMNTISSLKYNLLQLKDVGSIGKPRISSNVCNEYDANINPYKSTHFYLIEQMRIPKYSDIKNYISRIGKTRVENRTKYSSSVMSSKEFSSKKPDLYELQLDEGNNKESNSSTIIAKVNNSFRIPSIELRNQIEEIEKYYIEKLKKDFVNNKISIEKLKKKLAFAFGLQKSEKLFINLMQYQL